MPLLGIAAVDAARARPQNVRPSLPDDSKASMGKGDKKSKRGKIWRGTFGKRRPRVRNEKPAAKPAAK